MPMNTTPTVKITEPDSYERLDTLLKRLDTLLECRDLILLLTYTYPIKGTTHLQKQVFLLWRMLEDVSTDPGFFAHKSGPYSQVVADAMNDLKGQKFVREYMGKKYCITRHGRAYIQQKAQRMGIDLASITPLKTKWNEWDAHGITQFVYRTHPDYTAKTEAPELK